MTHHSEGLDPTVPRPPRIQFSSNKFLAQPKLTEIEIRDTLCFFEKAPAAQLDPLRSHDDTLNFQPRGTPLFQLLNMKNWLNKNNFFEDYSEPPSMEFTLDIIISDPGSIAS
jgi:hypothetical protein